LSASVYHRDMPDFKEHTDLIQGISEVTIEVALICGVKPIKIMECKRLQVKVQTCRAIIWYLLSQTIHKRFIFTAWEVDSETLRQCNKRTEAMFDVDSVSLARYKASQASLKDTLTKLEKYKSWKTNIKSQEQSS